MLGMTFDGGREVTLREFPDPKPGAGEVLLRVTASGMCGSDLHYYRADPDAPATAAQREVIGGHEPAGVVEELGPGVDPAHLAVGQRVMVVHYAGCGRCAACRSGWIQMCTGGSRVTYGKDGHGGHAPHMTVAAQSVLPMPASLSDQAAAAIGCGTGTAWGGLDRIGDIGGMDVVVFGQGPVGLSTTMFAAARGARVIAVDLSDGRLEQSRRFGAAETINPNGIDVVAAIKDMTAGGAAAVVETSGATAAAASGLEALAPWGRMCVIGLGGKVELDVRRFLSRQVTVMTSWSLSSVQQIACADFAARRELPLDDLFTDRWRIDQCAEAYRAFDLQLGGKGVFVF